MALSERVYRVLIVSSNEKFAKEISSLLSVEQFSIDYASNAGEARRVILDKAYDFVLINAPLRDEFGSRLGMDAGVREGTIAVLFAPSDVFDEIVHKVAPHGVFVVCKPASRSIVTQSLTLTVSARERLRYVEKKAGKAESKIEELRVVNKAKWLLIDNEDMSESDAHRYIEKAAMDSGITKKQAAQMIIEKYI